ncbi:MAG TPA: ROK family protein [Gaiellaceae bacterium]|nr:ROK family protein [Gaiellaceae bacterium]
MPRRGRTLAVDVGGTHVKALVEGADERRRFKTPRRLTAEDMVARTLELVDGWRFDRVSIGVPAQVVHGRVVHEPVNLGRGWIGFDYGRAFGKPTKVVNDAVMQAIGGYDGGKMLFLGFGTGLGSAMIVDGLVEALELGHLPFRRATFEDYVNREGRKRLGRKRWRAAVLETVDLFRQALQPDSILLGGGLADDLGACPANVTLGGNDDAFTGGFKLWQPRARRGQPALGYRSS